MTFAPFPGIMPRQQIHNRGQKLLKNVSLKNCLVNFFVSGVIAFGLYNVHAQSGVTEGGILGFSLVLDHWFDISPAVSSLILNAACYIFGWRTLGKEFIFYSIIANLGFSAAYAVCESFPPLWPEIANMPLLAALIGPIFIGIGAGLCVRCGGAPSGDDALAMSVSAVTKLSIQWVYMISDLTVLLLALTYIPFTKFLYSLLTVTLSGQIIGWVQKIPSQNTRNK